MSNGILKAEKRTLQEESVGKCVPIFYWYSCIRKRSLGTPALQEHGLARITVKARSLPTIPGARLFFTHFVCDAEG